MAASENRNGPPDASAPKGPVAPRAGSPTGAPVSGIPELDAEYARMMQAFDKVLGQEGRAAVEGEIDPELEVKLQQALAKYLATPKPQAGAALEGDTLDKALQAHVKPLFDALFTTALGHVKPTAEALKAGKEPPARQSDPIKVDLSSLFDPDDDEDAP